MNIILTLFTGLSISLMIFFNGSLEVNTNLITSLIYIHFTGLVITLVLLIKKGKKPNGEKRSPLFLLAGLLGIVIVAINNRIFSIGGVLLALSGTLTGQIITGTFIEVFKSKKSGKRLAFNKIVSVLIVLAGAVFLGYKSRIEPLFILISWIPGGLIILQTYMNSQNSIAIGFRKTLLFHFSLPLITLLICFLIMNRDLSFIKPIFMDFPKVYLFGGGAVSIVVVLLSSYLFIKIRALTFVLLINCGQIGGAILLDSLMGHTISYEKLIAGFLLIIGIIIGELPRKKL